MSRVSQRDIWALRGDSQKHVAQQALLPATPLRCLLLMRGQVRRRKGRHVSGSAVAKQPGDADRHEDLRTGVEEEEGRQGAAFKEEGEGIQ